MNGRLRMNIRKGVAFVILVNSSRRNGAIDDLAEKAAHNRTSVQECFGSGCGGNLQIAKPVAGNHGATSSHPTKLGAKSRGQAQGVAERPQRRTETESRRHRSKT